MQVKPANLKRTLIKKSYHTADIMDLVNWVAATDKEDTDELSSQFAPTRAGLKQLFEFVDKTFTYEEDPPNAQWVQTPSYFYHESRKGDCKSFTVFISSVVYSMGLDHIIRYSSYGTKDFRHVYPVIVLPDGSQVPMDVVWKKQEGGPFGQEKPYTKKKDFYMKGGLYKLGDNNPCDDADMVGQVQGSLAELKAVLADIPDTIVTDGPGDITAMTSGELDRYLMKQRLEIFAHQEKSTKVKAEYEKGIVALQKGTIAGIGNLESTPFGVHIANFLRKTDADNKPAFAPFQLAVPKPQNNAVTGIGDWLKDVGEVFKGLFTKLVNWVFKGPARAMAPYFLFTFIKDLTKSKEVNRRKAEQEKTYQWILKTGRFEDDKLKALIFNEIKAQSGYTPEEILNDASKAKIASPALIALLPKIISAMGFVVEVIKKIAGLFKKPEKEAGTVSKENAPDLKVLEELNQPTATTPTTTAGSGSGLAIAAGLAALTLFVI
jgi:hypothetical protein